MSKLDANNLTHFGMRQCNLVRPKLAKKLQTHDWVKTIITSRSAGPSRNEWLCKIECPHCRLIFEATYGCSAALLREGSAEAKDRVATGIRNALLNATERHINECRQTPASSQPKKKKIRKKICPECGEEDPLYPPWYGPCSHQLDGVKNA